MTKILVLNVGWSNKGNRALVISMIETIQKFVPDTEFTFVGPEPFKNEIIEIKRHAGYWLSLKKPWLTFRSMLFLIESSAMGLLRHLNIKINPGNKSPLYEYYNCDIVINSGGDSTSGESGIGTVPALLTIEYANLMGIPVVCYGESLGHFNNPILNFFAKIVYGGTSLILLREERSQQYLLDNHVVKPRIHLTADSAFLLNGASEARVQEIFSNEGIIKSNFMIGINPSGLIGRFRNADKSDYEELAKIFAKTIDYIIEEMNANVILVPHVFSKGGDDRESIQSILRYVSDKKRVSSITEEYDAPELKGIIGECDLFVGARMHATIASLSQTIPTISIAYSHKMYGIIGDMLGQKDYIIDIKDLDYNLLVSKICKAWENREQIRNELGEKIPVIREQALLNGVYVKELIDSLNNSKD